ncbi:MAG: glutamine amidotransferase, partial [Planctomycetota bacterium]
MNDLLNLPDTWAALDWLIPACVVVGVGLLVLVWSYLQVPTSGMLSVGLGFSKLMAFILLAICLLEPAYRYRRPEPGANLMVIMADNSQSLQIKDQGKSQTREAELKTALTEQTSWLKKMTGDFDVRRYQFNRRLQPVSSFIEYRATEQGSDLIGNLQLVSSRFEGRPSAGVLLFTDGNVTDAELGVDSIDWEKMPPVYPVLVGEERHAKDLGISKVTSTQTNFETSPVTLTAELIAHGYSGQRITVQLINDKGDVVDKTDVEKIQDGKTFAIRFRVCPEKRGINFYKVLAFGSGQKENNKKAESSEEATIANNEKMVVVDRGQGPFQILYVSGRPNWEYKFLHRAVESDPELEVIPLIRIAKKEAKFSFRGKGGQQSNSLFRGFESQDDDTTEQYDEPVFLRINHPQYQEDLKGGFPKDAETLFQFQAVILDDVEAGFFTQDQKSLLNRFVSIRGGGLMMLGGQESFSGGKYARNQIGEMLPIYLDPVKPGVSSKYKLDLTREGWLEPWIRVKATEELEQARLTKMPQFKTLNVSKSIKPGATVLATVEDNQKEYPAVVVQAFGKGRVGAMMIGDLWRWHLKSGGDNEDLMITWRQMLRWLVADVNQRVDVSVQTRNDTNRTVEISTRIRDEEYRTFDNATVKISVETPDGKTIELDAEPSDTEAGTYITTFANSMPGPYKATIRGLAEDGSEIQKKQAGWVSDLDSEEFRSLESNRELLDAIAQRSGGEVIRLESLDDFA